MSEAKRKDFVVTVSLNIYKSVGGWYNEKMVAFEFDKPEDAAVFFDKLSGETPVERTIKTNK